MAQSRPVAFASVNDVGERKGFLGLFGKKKNAVDKARDKLKDGEPDEETKVRFRAPSFPYDLPALDAQRARPFCRFKRD